jgi:tetratricopeptide (TPR) repeat protein
MPIPRSPEDDLADARELLYAGAMGFSSWDEKVYSISSQPLFVRKNVKAYRYEHCNELDKAEELYLENIAEGSSPSHCYERLTIMYRKQKRYDDEVMIIEKHLALDESDKQKLSERLEIPDQTGHRFRLKSATCSEANRPLIPDQIGRAFRSKSATPLKGEVTLDN